MSRALRIDVAGAGDAAAWNAYVAAHGSFFHRYEWATLIERTYGHKPLFLLARQGTEVAGILPLIDRRSALFGRALISTAFTVGGGAVAETDAARDQLIRRALELGKVQRSDYVELRTTDLRLEGWHEKHGLYDAFSLDIDPDVDKRLKAIPRKKRADIRKAIDRAAAGNLVPVVTRDAQRFWEGFARAQRDHGTPVFPLRYVEQQLALFGDDVEIAFIEADGVTVAGVMNYYHRDTVYLYNAFISDAARQLHAGDFLYWWMMGQGAARGRAQFDLGRSKRGSGSHAYKTFWGIEPKPLTYLYKLLQTDEMPNVSPTNPKFEKLTEIWSRLPLPVANRLGPMLAGHLA